LDAVLAGVLEGRGGGGKKEREEEGGRRWDAGRCLFKTRTNTTGWLGNIEGLKQLL